MPPAPLLALLLACGGSAPGPSSGNPSPAGERERVLTIFHAGSLSVPFAEMEAAFEAAHPGVDVQREAAGSRTCARKLSELGRRADVFASADVSVIDSLLVPEHASWSLPFATNEMVLVYRPEAESLAGLAPGDWHGLLEREGVALGRSDPEQDPCGYRTVMVLELAEQELGEPGLARRVLEASRPYVRPKETDLLALLEAGELDALFIYRSVAEQHQLHWMPLPPEINLGDPAHAEDYARATVELSGKAPGEKVVKRGAPMVYGVTIPRNAPEPELAVAFVGYLLDPEGGRAILERNGQPPLPARTRWYDALPPALQALAEPLPSQETPAP